MKINLKTYFAGLVAAVLVGGAVADTKIRLRTGNDFIIEQRKAAAPHPDRQKVYQEGGVQISNLTTDQRNKLDLKEADAGTMVWDTGFKHMVIWDGTSWKFTPTPIAFAQSGDLDNNAAAEFTTRVMATAPGVVECNSGGCTVNVDGTYRILARVNGSDVGYLLFHRYHDYRREGRKFKVTRDPCSEEVNPSCRNYLGVYPTMGQEVSWNSYALRGYFRFGEKWCVASVTLDGKRLADDPKEDISNLHAYYVNQWGLVNESTNKTMGITNNIIELKAGNTIGIKTYDMTTNDPINIDPETAEEFYETVSYGTRGWFLGPTGSEYPPKLYNDTMGHHCQATKLFIEGPL